MGLFDKKTCDVCGDKIGLLGNRKLEDGNLCKNCAAKLSPWFSERRKSTVNDIKGQLAYREQNKQAVSQFQTTRSIGRRYKVMLDENNRKFLVTKAKSLADENPDVLDYSQVTGYDLDIRETRNELKRKDAEGKMVSYNPPRYEYRYDFYCTISVNHPYFDEIQFKLNPEQINVGELATRPGRGPAIPAGKSAGEGLAGAFGRALAAGLNGNSNTLRGPEYDRDYQEYLQMSDEIRAALMGARQEIREEINAANAPKVAVQCPYCGASTTPDANGCCEFCGGALGNR